MRIVVTDAGIPAGSLFRLIFAGYVLGTGAIAVGLVLFSVLLALVAPEQVGVLEVLLMVITTPVILASQGLMIGVIVLFGLWIYRKFRDIRVERPSGAAAWPSQDDR